MARPDWLDAACDRLKEVGLDDAAGWMERHAYEDERRLQGLRIYIRPAIRNDYRKLAAFVDGWCLDPSPKIAGLRISVDYRVELKSLQLVMTAGEFSCGRILSEHEVERVDFGWFVDSMDDMHRRIVRGAREKRWSDPPASATEMLVSPFLRSYLGFDRDG